jgi:type II secretory pathway pseudopilin PulG
MTMTEAKKSNKAVWLLVGCGGGLLVLIFGGGILAAIAIPAFMKFQNKSKQAMAKITVTRMAQDAAMAYMDGCAFPPSAPRSSALPVGGEKVAPTYSGPGWEAFQGMDPTPQFFAYSALAEGNRFTVIAEADFVEGGPQYKATVTLTGDKEACSADVGDLIIINEDD